MDLFMYSNRRQKPYCFYLSIHLCDTWIVVCLPGVLTHDIEMFGNSWVEAEPREAQCPIVPSGFPSPCAAVDAHVLLVSGQSSVKTTVELEQVARGRSGIDCY